MEKYTQKQLRALVSSGAATDVTYAQSQNEIPEAYRQIGYSQGLLGLNGMLLRGEKSGTLYAVTKRTKAVYIF